MATADSAPVRTAPALAVVMPEGWLRLRLDDTVDRQISDALAQILPGVARDRRDIARVVIKRQLSQLAAASDGIAYEAWMPVAMTGGVMIPAAVTVAPAPPGIDPARSVADHLTGFAAASPGSALLEVGGRPAVRTFADIAGRKEGDEWVSLPRRRVVTIVSPPASGGEWLVFFAEIVVPEVDGAEIVAACEFFLDALLKTVRFAGEGS